MHSDSTLWFDVPRPQRLSRLLIFVKWILVVPHLFILWAYGILAAIAGFIGWWAVLFTGSYPVALWNTVYGFMRWNTRVSVYYSLLRDEYPPFGEEPYPMEMHLERPERQSRLLLIGRIFLMIPLSIWLSVVGIVAVVLLFISFFAILVTGNIPADIYRMLVGFFRYSLRVNLYSYVLTDEWPGFRMS